MCVKIRVLLFPSDTQKSLTAAKPSQHHHEEQWSSDTPFYATGILQPLTMGAKKNSKTIKRQTSEDNDVKDVSVRGFPIDARGR